MIQSDVKRLINVVGSGRRAKYGDLPVLNGVPLYFADTKGGSMVRNIVLKSGHKISLFYENTKYKKLKVLKEEDLLFKYNYFDND